MAQPAMEPNWSHFRGFQQPADKGALIADLEGDGTNEAVVLVRTALPYYQSKQYIAVLRQVEGALEVSKIQDLGDDEQAYSSALLQLPTAPGEPATLLGIISNNDRAATHHMVVTFTGPTLTRRELFPVPAGFQQPRIADVDGDGALELIGTRHQDLAVHDLATGAQEYFSEGIYARNFALAQLDADPALEIIVGGRQDSMGLVLDGASHEVEWQSSEAFYGEIVTGNFDDEPSTTEFAILPTTVVSQAAIYTGAPSYSLISRHPVEGPWEAHAKDLNADGVDEVVVLPWLRQGAVVGYDTRSGDRVFTFPADGHRVYSAAFGNLDGDANIEMLMGSEQYGGVGYTLRAVDTATAQIQYEQTEDRSPYTSTLIADLDQDGHDEVVLATVFGPTSNISRRKMAVLNAESGKLLRERVEFPESRGGSRNAKLMAMQLDEDPQLEILLGYAVNGEPSVTILDGLSLETEGEWRGTNEFAAVASMALLPGRDGEPPMLAVAAYTRLYLLSLPDLTQVWRSPEMSYSHEQTYIVLANIDDDPAEEIVWVTWYHASVFDRETMALKWSRPLEGEWLGVSVEGEGPDCRLVVLEPTRIARRDCGTLEVDTERRYVVQNAQFAQLLGDSYGKLLVAQGNRLVVQQAQAVLRSFQSSADELGSYSRGEVAPGNGGLVAFIGDRVGVHAFQIEPSSVLPHPGLYRDGFE